MKTTQEYLNFAKDWLIKQGSSLNYTNHSLGARMLKAWDEHQSAQPTQTEPEKEELVEFNLEEALEDKSRVRFRNGETPLDWHYFDQLHDKTFPIVSIKAHEQRVNLTKDGFFMKGGNKDDYDLMLVKKKEVVWFGLYKDKHGVMYTTDVQNTKEEVEEYIDGRKILKFYSYEE